MSYYNSRLNPIQGRATAPKAVGRHAFQGLPLAETEGPATRKPPPAQRRAATGGQRRQAVAAPASVKRAPAAVPVACVVHRASTTSEARVVAPPPPEDKRPSTTRPASCSTRHRGKTKDTKRHSEWRDIQVKSLTRVDSILRGEIGLGAQPARWKTMYALAGGQPHAASSGLGIMIAQSGRPALGLAAAAAAATATADARPGTAHAHLARRAEPAAGQKHQPLQAQRASHSPPWDFEVVGGARGETASALARPSTSSARLGQSTRRHPSGGGGGAPAASGSSRVLSMQMPTLQAAAAPRVRRPISVFNPASRLIQLSRDESRRSRLFNEYENLVAHKDADNEADDEDDGASGGDDAPDEPAFSAGGRPHTSTTTAAATVRHRPGDLTSIVEESDGSSSSFEDVVGTLRPAARLAGPRPATAQRHPAQVPRPQRDRHTTSMYVQGGQASQQQQQQQQQTERRWSRIISQNQHLFNPQPTTQPPRHDAWLHESAQGQATDASRPGPGAGSRRLSSAPPLVLDLPQSADLFQDMAQALAERLPPLSAGSTASTSSASTVVLWPDSLASSSPLSALRRPQSASGGAGSAGASPASDKQDVDAPVVGSRASSIYLDPESLFGGVIFGGEDLPHEQSGMDLLGGASLRGPQTERTPTTAANSLPSEELVAETRSAAGGSDATDDEAACQAARRRSQAREELRRVEETTPASGLGAVLSKDSPAHRELLAAYMERFNFEEQPIDFALRQLFRELRLPAESQQIDRIITGFAQSYHARNPGLFHSADVVYAYAFAILLLHTDAHNPRIKHKITKAQFTARARLLDDSASGQGSEMFDEVLDILYDNVTMVKFEYAPGVGGGEPFAAGHLPPVAGVAAAAPEGARDQSPGISGWLRRMFAPAAAPATPTTPAKLPLSPQDIPSKEQYSYTAVGRRRVGSVSGLNGSIAALGGTPPPQLPQASRPCTSHGTFPRSNSAFLAAAAAAGGLDGSRAALATSTALPRARAFTTELAAAAPLLSPIDTSVGRQAYGATPPASSPPTTCSFATATSPTADSGLVARDVLRVNAARPFKSSPLAGGLALGTARNGSGRREFAPSSPASDPLSPHSPAYEAVSPRSPRGAMDLASGFAAIDLAVPAQPLAVESIRLKGLKSHVRRRVSLRTGRPLSGIIYPSAGADPGQSTGGRARSPPPGPAGSALLRVDMAGYVARKMDRLDNGRRGLVRRWKSFWMVLSGSRLYMFRPGDAAHPECQLEPSSPDASALHLAAGARAALAIQTIVPLRNGVAIVDAAYTKYPHVFRILADDGSEMLVKAADDDAVAEWMARINCAAAFKTADVDRRTVDAAGLDAAPAGCVQRAELLEGRLAELDQQLDDIDDRLERSLRLYKQLASMVPLTRQARARTMQHAEQARARLKELYLSEQRLTCYKDVLELDLAIEYELCGHLPPAVASP